MYQYIYCSIQTFKPVDFSLTSDFSGPGSHFILLGCGSQVPLDHIGVLGPGSQVQPRGTGSRVLLFRYAGVRLYFKLFPKYQKGWKLRFVNVALVGLLNFFQFMKKMKYWHFWILAKDVLPNFSQSTEESEEGSLSCEGSLLSLVCV